MSIQASDPLQAPPTSGGYDKHRNEINLRHIVFDQTAVRLQCHKGNGGRQSLQVWPFGVVPLLVAAALANQVLLQCCEVLELALAFLAEFWVGLLRELSVLPLFR